MLRIAAIIFGIIFIFIGVAGFLPTFNPNGYLFNYFQVDTIHNIIHIVTGVLAIMSATTYKSAKLYFQVFGILYVVVAVVGFWRGDVFFMPVNTSDNILHIVFAVIFLLLGFPSRKEI